MATAIRNIEEPTNLRSALIVDDSKIACNVLSRLLAKLGYRVDTAHSAESALKHLAGPLPDVVFMDHLLPGMDGVEAVSRLREQPRTARLPIVMYTSQESDEFATTARQAGADDVYPKSANQSVLRDILMRLDLMPARPGAPPPQPERSTGETTREDLRRLLEPSLSVHYARLHQDLLAEFAILERYEERMRRDLFSRFDSLTKESNDEVYRFFAARRRERELEYRASARRWWSVAAGIVLALGVTLTLAWSTAQRDQTLTLQGADIQATLVAQSEAINDLDARLVDLQLASSAEPSPSDPTVAPSPNPASLPREEAPRAATALVSELQAMGILGPVRIETSAGSFCVKSTAGGYQIEASNLELKNCEPLPVRLADATW